ncbi:MAG TPA: ABC transporter ATP-binding protein [Actinomycetota bacterium]|nr:ABC transporter ATP-binding protein [Actinomycetota bacterium]
MRSKLRALGLLVSTAFRADPWRSVLTCVLVPVLGLTTAANGLWLKVLADSALRHHARTALLAAAALAATVGLVDVARLALARVRLRLQERTGLLLERRLVELAASLPGLEHHERPDYLDRLEHLRAERATLGQAIGALVASCTTVVQAVGIALLLASVHPALLVLPLLGLPSLWTGGRSVTIVDSAKRATAEKSRLAGHYLAMATSVGPAKELRLFGLGEEILRRHRRLAEESMRTRVRARLGAGAWDSAGSLLFVGGYLAAIAFVIRRASLGLATPGEVLLTLQLAGQVSGNVVGIVEMARWLQRALLVAGYYLWFVDYSRGTPSGRAPVAAPGRLGRGIALEDVSFRYPGTEASVLHNVNLVLPAGRVVALVGDNGAGKSTLVKLLCGFYQPSSGRITVDGIDLADIDVDQWRAGLSGAFQDFCNFEFIARETVGVGDTRAIDDAGRVEGAMKRAGAIQVLDALPDGLATQLGRTFDGVELSQGQWQKLALSRSRMRSRPLLYVLDEPTASLDPASEHELYSEIIRTARHAASQGAITLLVSHRMSTVRAADLIVVVDEGGVAEIGSHIELMQTPGLYAELYALQSRGYR